MEMTTDKDNIIKELVEHIEEFIDNHPKECNDNYIEIVAKAKKILDNPSVI